MNIVQILSGMDLNGVQYLLCDGLSASFRPSLDSDAVSAYFKPYHGTKI